MPSTMNSDLQVKWRKTIDVVQRQLSDVLQQRRWATRLGEMTRQNKNFTRCASPFMREMSRWYGANAIMAVRRQADDDKRVVSLRRMLEQMKANPPALISISPMGTMLTADEIEADVQRLKAVSDRIVRFADKQIAHAERGAGFDDDSDRVTFKELNDCVDAYADVAKKYVLILTGGTLLSLEPTELFDPTDVFRFPWIPNCTECGHSADYHVGGGKLCNGWTADYRRAMDAGEHGMPKICECKITKSDVYSQTQSPPKV